jgi:hypothetical protein
MATDLERLVVSLSADIRGLERNMRKAGMIVADEMGKIDNSIARGADRISSRMGEIGIAGQMMAGVLKGAFSVAAIGTFITMVSRAVDEVAKLDDQAKRLSLSTDRLQELRFAFRESGVPGQAFEQGATALRDKANAEFREGEGELSRLLEANNSKLTDRAGKLRSIEDLLMQAAKLIQNAATEADKVDIAKAFGLSADWVSALERGPDALRDIAEQAKSVGAVLDNEAIRKAAEFEKEWTATVNRWADAFKAAILPIAKMLGDLAASASGMLDKAGGFLRDKGIDDKLARGAYGELSRGEIERVRQIAEKNGVTMPGAVHRRYNEILEGDRESARGAALTELSNRKAAVAAASGRTTIIPRKASGGGGGASEKADEYDREEKRINRQIRDLGAQAEAIGKTTYEAAKAEAQFKLLTAAEQAGRPITDELRASVEQLAEAYARAKEKAAEAQLAQRQFVELQSFFGDSLVGIAKGATQGMEGLRNAISRVADALLDASLQALILGKGPLAGLLGMGTTSNGGVGGLVGMLFGGMGIGGSSGGGSIGANADGSTNWRGGPTWVGERGPELLNLPKGAQILSASQSRAVAGKSSPVVSNDNRRTYHIDAKGAELGVEAKIVRALREYDAQLPSRLEDRQMRGI